MIHASGPPPSRRVALKVCVVCLLSVEHPPNADPWEADDLGEGAFAQPGVCGLLQLCLQLPSCQVTQCLRLPPRFRRFG